MPDDVKAGDRSRDGRARRWDTHRARRRGEFVDAAVAVIERLGPDVHVEQIAAEAGVPRPVLYRHFKDRSDLDVAIARRAGEMLLSTLWPALKPSGTPLGAISTMVETYLRWLEAHPDLYRFVSGRSAAARDQGADVRTAVGERATVLLENYLRWHHLDPGPAEPLAFGLVGLIDSAIDRWLKHGTGALDRRALAAHLVSACWNVIDGELRAGGVHVDPHAPLSQLAATS